VAVIRTSFKRGDQGGSDEPKIKSIRAVLINIHEKENGESKKKCCVFF
jgi:hypothetical protein